MTEEEIIKIWNSIPPQGDPTGKKFAVKFAEALIFKPMSEESKQELVSNYFSEDWAQNHAMMMLEDYEKSCSKS